MAKTHDLLVILESYENKAESRGYELRLSLADVMLRGLRARGWSQKQLADAAQMKASFINRIIHGDSNCTFDVAGRLLFALGIHVHFVEKAKPDQQVIATTETSSSLRIREVTGNGKKTIQIRSTETASDPNVVDYSATA